MFTQKQGHGSSSRWSFATGSSTTLGGAPWPGSFVGGRYRLEGLIGQGAHKRVHLAWDSRLDRRVAVAIIKLEGMSDDLAERVRREARTVARLPQHRGLVTVYDA